MKNKSRFILLFSCLLLGSQAAFPKGYDKNDDNNCSLSGSYGYLYNGTGFSSVPVPFSETGSFTAGTSGQFGGEGTMSFYYSNFNGKGPLWLLLHEVQSNGTVTYDVNNPCSGTVDFFTTATVIKSSNPALIPEDNFVLISNAPRSVAFTISGKNKEIVDLISTSPGTIASGTAHKQYIRHNH